MELLVLCVWCVRLVSLVWRVCVCGAVRLNHFRLGRLVGNGLFLQPPLGIIVIIGVHDQVQQSLLFLYKSCPNFGKNIALFFLLRVIRSSIKSMIYSDYIHLRAMCIAFSGNW